MTGPEHYAAADLELERIENDEGDNDALQDYAYRMELLARAQVHATLALAAATVSALHAGGPFAGLAVAEWTEALKP